MRLILHIGTEKTGTTALQNWLHRNTPALRRAGVWYSQCFELPNNRAIAVLGRGPDHPDEAFEAFGITDAAAYACFAEERAAALEADVAAARRAGARVYLVSSEHLHSRLLTQDMVDRIAALTTAQIPKEMTQVVCFLRPQVELAMSLASTQSRVGIFIGRNRYSKISPKQPYFDYFGLLERWAEAYGREAVLPVPYRRNRSPVAWLATHLELNLEDYAPEPRSNSALDHRVIALNNALQGRDGGLGRRGEPGRTIPLDLFPFEEPVRMARPNAREVQKRFGHRNLRVAQTWPQIEIEDLRPDFEAFPVKGTLESIEECDFSAQFRWLVALLDGRVLLAEARTCLLRAEIAMRDGDAAGAAALVGEAEEKLAGNAAVSALEREAAPVREAAGRARAALDAAGAEAGAHPDDARDGAEPGDRPSRLSLGALLGRGGAAGRR